MDPVLRSKAAHLRLAERLWDGGMLGFTGECKEIISLFGVVKKHLPSEDGPPERSIRPV